MDVLPEPVTMKNLWNRRRFRVPTIRAPSISFLTRLLWCVAVLATFHLTVNIYNNHKTNTKFKIEEKKRIVQVLRSKVHIGRTISHNAKLIQCDEGEVCVDYADFARLVISTKGHCIRVTWTSNTMAHLRDCVKLNGHWYGGNGQYQQSWPIEKLPLGETPFVTGGAFSSFKVSEGGVAEPYWVSSTGLAVVVSELTPLFVSMPDTDDDGTADELCLSARQSLPYWQSDETTRPLVLDYYLCSADDVRKVHEATYPLFFGRPYSLPDNRMIREPSWKTWSERTNRWNTSAVMQLADDIIRRGYPYSQLVIDYNWETCYGSAEFNRDIFSDPKSMVDELHTLGFRVTLWVHPFINSNCYASDHPFEMGYFVKDDDNETRKTIWSYGSSAGIIDFTNPDAVAWWSQRLYNLKDKIGIDSFKFDAGESTWLPKIFKLHADKHLWPNVFTTKYVEVASKFGGLVEVRSARGNQRNPIFFRMLEKSANWGNENGLKTVVTTLLHFGLLGYPFVLPETVGGNGYGVPNEELFVRWMQAAAFMPTIQYGIPPWVISDTAEAVALEMSRLHARYSPLLVKAAQDSTISVAAICRPTWWLCPTYEACLTADQQFLVGDELLVAPILSQDATKKVVVFPPGTWRQDITGKTYQGVTTQTFVNVNLHTFLYFKRVE